MSTSGWPEFPGAVGISDLSAYPWPTADDEHGGSPHMHLTCAEAYVVIGGRGRLQTLNHSGPSVQTLDPGDVIWFTPGTIHRAINDGGLHVIVIMQNGGLPEAGDAVMTFPHEHMAPERYLAAASVRGADGRPSDERARARRDLAVGRLHRAAAPVETGQPLRTRRLPPSGDRARRVSPERMAKLVEQGAAATAAAALDHIDALGREDTTHLTEASVNRIPALSETTLGMCGHLRAFDPIRRLGPGS